MGKMIVRKPRPGVSTAVVYLAGPIEKLGSARARSWRQFAGMEIAGQGAASFDPAAAWNVPNLTGTLDQDLIDRIVQPVDDIALAYSHSVLVHYCGVESRGTDHEIRQAHLLRLPVVIWVDEPDGLYDWLGRFDFLSDIATMHPVLVPNALEQRGVIIEYSLEEAINRAVGQGLINLANCLVSRFRESDLLGDS